MWRRKIYSFAIVLSLPKARSSQTFKTFYWRTDKHQYVFVKEKRCVEILIKYFFVPTCKNSEHFAKLYWYNCLSEKFSGMTTHYRWQIFYDVIKNVLLRFQNTSRYQHTHILISHITMFFLFSLLFLQYSNNIIEKYNPGQLSKKLPLISQPKTRPLALHWVVCPIRKSGNRRKRTKDFIRANGSYLFAFGKIPTRQLLQNILCLYERKLKQEQVGVPDKWSGKANYP